MNKEKAIIDNLNDERVATLVEKETLADKRRFIPEERNVEPKVYGLVYPEKDVKKFIQDIINVCEEESFDVMIKDGEDGDITINLSAYIRRRAGKGLL